MEIIELITESFGTLTRNKLRTGLAMLGIVIGISSVIALISLGQASQQSVQSQIQSLGSNLLTVTPGSQNSGGVRSAAGSSTTLTYDDTKAMSSDPTITALVANISPELSRRSQVVAGGNNTNTQVIGVTQVYPTVHNVTMAEGSFITANDVVALSRVAVIGPQAAATLFPTSDPVGQTILINHIIFTVVGETQSKGGSGFLNQDDIIFVPLTTAQEELYGVTYLSSVALQAKNPDVMTDAENAAGYFLLQRHKISDPSQADFSIISQADILGAASSVTGIFTTLLSGIAAISLLVGGIGIMNIMLVTVTERTREIGLRKALGAKKNTIVTQFLIESIILTLVGGFIGMLLGVGLSFTVSHLIGLPFILALSSVFLAIGVSGGIGILFGWYPAKRASDLSPIEALRYE